MEVTWHEEADDDELHEEEDRQQEEEEWVWVGFVEVVFPEVAWQQQQGEEWFEDEHDVGKDEGAVMFVGGGGSREDDVGAGVDTVVTRVREWLDDESKADEWGDEVAGMMIEVAFPSGGLTDGHGFGLMSRRILSSFPFSTNSKIK